MTREHQMQNLIYILYFSFRLDLVVSMGVKVGVFKRVPIVGGVPNPQGLVLPICRFFITRCSI